MKKIYIIISILAFILVFCCFSYFYGVFTIENRLEQLCDCVSERNLDKIDSMIFANADIYIENSDGTVICNGVYADVKDKIKKVLKDENIHINLSMLEYSATCKIFTVCARNPLFFTNEANGDYGELKYEVEFANIPFFSKIVSIKVIAI